MSQQSTCELMKWCCRVSEKLNEVQHKIKIKEQEQCDDDRYDLQLAELDKRAAMANRARGSNKSDRGNGRVLKDDPYSRKRTVEKLYWSTGQKHTVMSTTQEERENAEETQVRMCSFAFQCSEWQHLSVMLTILLCTGGRYKPHGPDYVLALAPASTSFNGLRVCCPPSSRQNFSLLSCREYSRQDSCIFGDLCGHGSQNQLLRDGA